MYMYTVYKGSIFCTPTLQKGFLSRDNYCPVLANFRAFCGYKQMWCSVPTFTSSRQKQPQSNGLIITRFPLSFHCQFDTLFRHHTGHLLLKWVRSTARNHPLKIKKAIEENILQFRRWCGGRKRGSAPGFEVQVVDVWIAVCLLPPSAIKPRRLHQSHYSLDSGRLNFLVRCNNGFMVL